MLDAAAPQWQMNAIQDDGLFTDGDGEISHASGRKPRSRAPMYCKRDRTASKRKCWSDRRSEFCVRRDFGHPATIRTQDTPPSLYSGHMIGCVYFLGAYGRLQDAPVGALPVHAHTQNSNVLGRGCLPFPYLTCFWADSCETTTIVFVF